MAELIKVGMAELAVASNPAQITTIGLGSCVGIVLYDGFARIGGLAHVMLPSISLSKDKTNKAKFADTAIDVMLEEMKALGSRKINIHAKLFGGANMFEGMVHSKGLMDMGHRNAEMVKQELADRGIEIIAEETGANFGRTITLDTATGKVYLRTATGDQRTY
jgi:chemotaxis protein CheD